MRRPISIVWSSPLYRGATVAMFLSTFGAAAVIPQLATFLTKDLHASYSVAGLYFLTSLTIPVAGYLVGSLSDRTGRRLGLFRACAVINFVGSLAFGFATAVWMAFAISSLLMCFGWAAGSQLFAAVHDELDGDPKTDDSIMAIVRMGMTAGWVVGPVAGTLLAAAAGVRTLVLVTAVCSLLQILPLGTLGGARQSSQRAAVKSAKPTMTQLLPLLAFCLCYMGVNAAEAMKLIYIPIYLRDNLHVSAGVSGIILGFQPLLEFALMPAAVLLGRKIGAFRLLAITALCACAGHFLFATSGSVTGIVAGQFIQGCVWAAYAGLGIIVAQRLVPNAIATTSAIFVSVGPLAGGMGGLTGGLAAAHVGLPHVFLVAASMTLAAAFGLAVMAWKPADTVLAKPEVQPDEAEPDGLSFTVF